MGNYTPMIQQYLEIKKQYPNAILFFRLGDFYEMFFEDAENASQILQITLTGRDAGKGQRVPMCGVPYHSADTYISKLINTGLKVAICEQVSDPSDSPGLVEREVVRIITPGTLVDSSMLEEGSNNYIVSLGSYENAVGLAYADVSTGLFRVTEFDFSRREQLLDELHRLSPAEIVIAEKVLEKQLGEELSIRFPQAVLNPVSSFDSTYQGSRQKLLDHFGVLTLDCFQCEDLKAGIVAAGMLLGYLHKLGKNALVHLTRLQTYKIEGFLVMDSITRKHLELVGEKHDKKHSLFDVLNHTRTSMGSRLLKTMIQQPLMDLEEIEDRLDAVEELKDNTFLRKRLSGSLARINDLERLSARVDYNQVSPRDMLQLRNSLAKIPEIIEIFEGVQARKLTELRKCLDPLDNVVSLITGGIREDAAVSLTEGNIIKPGYNEEVDCLREFAANSKKWIIDLETRERQRSGIKSLKVKYNKVFGYFIEITNSNLESVPDDYIRKQTLVNCERFITNELKAFETEALGAQEKLYKLEYQLYSEIREVVASHTTTILQNADAISQLDFLQSLAEAAAANNYTRPKFDDTSGIIAVCGGRHPVVEQSVGEEIFVSNDVFLDQEDQRIIILTGPNMSGKSTFLRQVALIVLMAQIGSFVPAEKAELSLTDRIFTRIGASDDISTGRSTFMVEMSEVANILHNATNSSLILLDEVGRGTATYDGLSLAWAIVEHLTESLRAKTLFATHYHELTSLADRYRPIKNYFVAAREIGDKIAFLHKVLPGKSDRSYGIQVARLAGLPPRVTKRAAEILAHIQSNSWDNGSHSEDDQSSLSPEKENLLPEMKEALSIISDLDLQNITPIEALNLLYELQGKLQNSPKKDSGVV